MEWGPMGDTVRASSNRTPGSYEPMGRGTTLPRWLPEGALWHGGPAHTWGDGLPLRPPAHLPMLPSPLKGGRSSVLVSPLARRLLTGFALLWASSAQAQTALEIGRVATDGLDQPATSAALSDGPEASSVNPAGLHFIDGLSFRYLHQQGLTGDLPGPDGDGVYLGGKFFSPIGWGVSIEWLRDDFGGDVRRTTWALSLGGDSLGIGASVHTFSSDESPLDGVASVDLGLMTRPVRWLSLGFAVHDVDGSTVGSTHMPRRFVVGAGVRPLGDWLTLSLDARIPSGKNTPIETGWEATILSWTARAIVADGVGLFGALAHRADASGPVAGQVGLALDFGHVGLQGTPLLASGGADPGFLVAADLRAHLSERRLEARRSRVAVVDLDSALRKSKGLQLFPSEHRDPMIDTIEGFHRLADDEDVEAVLVKVRDLPVGIGQAWEIRQALVDLKRRGKKVAVYLGSADDTEYWVATAADRIFVAPEASLSVNGFTSDVNFYGETLAAIGVEVQVARVGAYKNFPDVFTRSEISNAHREVVDSLLDDLFGHYEADVLASRGYTKERFREVLATGLQSARLARDLDLVDEIVWEDELGTAMARLLGGPIPLRHETLEPMPWTSWGPPPVIAVIPIDGTIVAGRGGGGFGLFETTGERTVVEALDRAAADASVRAIVLRIDSGGGDAAGSQRIWRAVTRARAKKPVIASLADHAASGGYFAAAGAHRIVAAPSTYTGSIGVFWLKPSFQGLLETLKVHRFSSTRGERADIQSIEKPWTEGDREVIQNWVDAAYLDFVEAVAQGRDLTTDEVDRVARGRVWTGSQAMERGLVDDLGGLSEALRWARDQAGLGTSPVSYRIYRPSTLLLTVGPGGVSVNGGALDSSWPEPLAEALRQGVPAPLLLSSEAGMWALSPWNFQIR